MHTVKISPFNVFWGAVELNTELRRILNGDNITDYCLLLLLASSKLNVK
jgi:hypothetical protein